MITHRPFSGQVRDARDLDASIARCRLVLSVLGIVGWYVDPTAPMLTRWLPVTGGTFVLDPYWLSVLFAHLAYSLTLLVARRRSTLEPERLATVGTWGDVLFGAAIALVTEGETSLYHVFFAFAVVSVAARSGLRAALGVTAANLTLYVLLAISAAPHHPQFFMMRAAYLAIIGYLVGYLGQARLWHEARLRAVETSTQRERIARSLHDGCVQALAGVNLRVETSSELLRRGQTSDALAELAKLQADVNHEHDELRAYVRSLVERDSTPARPGDGNATRFRVHVDFEGTLALVEHALLIALEGARNVHRHAYARRATIDATIVDPTLVVSVDDDGRGFPADASPPWSIASRVAEVGGDVAMMTRYAGGHLRVALRTA